MRKFLDWKRSKFGELTPELQKNRAYYLGLLGLTERELDEAGNATAQRMMIRKCVRKCVADLHPDQFQQGRSEDAEAALVLTKEILEAQDVLLAAIIGTDQQGPRPPQTQEDPSRESDPKRFG